MNANVVRAALRRIGLVVFALRLDAAVRFLNRRSLKIILLHAVEPAESEFTSGLDVNTPPDRLAENLDWLAERYSFISLDDLESGRTSERGMMLTFDDGYRSLLTHALPIFAEREVPATVYLVTEAIGNEHMVWVNEASWLLRNHPGPAGRELAPVAGIGERSSTESFIHTLQDDFDAERVAQAIDRIWESVPDDRSRFLVDASIYLDWDEVRSMTEHGFSFGCHTATHPNMVGLGDDAARHEIMAAKDRIVAELGLCTSFAYPFGFRDERIEAIAIGCGFASIMEVGGTNGDLDLDHCARIAIDEATNAELFAEMEIVVPVIAVLNRATSRLRSLVRR